MVIGLFAQTKFLCNWGMDIWRSWVCHPLISLFIYHRCLCAVRRVPTSAATQQAMALRRHGAVADQAWPQPASLGLPPHDCLHSREFVILVSEISVLILVATSKMSVVASTCDHGVVTQPEASRPMVPIAEDDQALR